MSRQQGPLLNTQIRLGYASSAEADPFVRELLVLLVGIEGTQNNVMALHAPMVTDLVAEGSLTWSQALFTGSRNTDPGSIPWFAFAADKNQKGSSDKSRGPMERQMELLCSGSFDIVAGSLDMERVRNNEKRAILEQYIERELLRFAEKIDKEVTNLQQTKYKKKLEGAKDVATTSGLHKTIRDEAKNKIASQARTGWETINGVVPKASSREPHAGYLIFQHAYMARQFALQQRFFTTMFPQVTVLDFSGPANFMEFAERLIERYLFQRFYGDRWRGMSANLDRGRDAVDTARHRNYIPDSKFL